MKILTVFGTRPEAIKMAPLVDLLSREPSIEHKLCITGQHREMLTQVMNFFGLQADFDLGVMRHGQDLTDLTSDILLGMRGVFKEFEPDWVLVHGDTTTCFATSLAAFYAHIKVGHVEAGLRTRNMRSPFPEEANRVLTDRLASAYFVPTTRNAENLIEEGTLKELISVTGNTIIDALSIASERVSSFSDKIPKEIIVAIERTEKILLVTGHRRENFGAGFNEICDAIGDLASQFPDLAVLYPVHLNPNVQKPVYKKLGQIPNVFLVEPFDYPDFVFAMQKSWAILTDSGGVQEEAPSLGKPVLVMRDTTERPEAVEAGGVKLVGADRSRIVAGVKELWENEAVYQQMSGVQNPYGDGKASRRIVDFLLGREVLSPNFQLQNS